MSLAAELEPVERETRWSELDPRSLAVGRILLGLFVLLSLLSSAFEMEAFFTDRGVLPREVLLRSAFANEWLCLHLGTGGLAAPAVLTVLLCVCAVGLMVGWHTRPMVLGCWVLFNSMLVRNPFIGDRGDLELSLMLFWGFFLPLGSRWSWDASRGRGPGPVSPRGMAAAALVAQFGMIYLFAAYHKNGAFWLGRGDGLEHSLISPLFATPLSLWLARAAGPWLTSLNFAVVAGEVFVGMLLLCPWSVPLTRGIAVALLLGFHLAVGVLFQLGLFPWLGGLLALLLLPREFWEGGGRSLGQALDRRLTGAEVEGDSLTGGRLWAREAWLCLCLLLALSSNLYTVWPRSFPSLLQGASQALRLAQHWELFSPIPPYYGSFILEGKGADGKVVTMFAGPPTREDPKLAPFPSHRWRMLMAASMYPDFALIRPGLVRLLAQRSGMQGIEPTFYGFRIRLPDDRGELQAPITWALWPGGMPSPENAVPLPLPSPEMSP